MPSLHTGQDVVITGIGMVSPLGVGLSENWASLVSGRSGIRPITRFDASGLATTFAGEVPDFSAEDFLPRKEAKRISRFMAYAVAAARMAVEDAHLPEAFSNDFRSGVYVGCGIGGLDAMEENMEILARRGPGRVSPFFVPHFIPNMAGGLVSIHLGLKGPNLTFSTACAAGAHAIGEAFHRIRDGYADMMLAGGSEAAVTRSALAGFGAMRALSTRNEAPEFASRPFDKDRDGFVLGEGASFLVLENGTRARERGARIYAKLSGYGASCDAYHMTAPDPEGIGMKASMEMALSDASLQREAIEWINAHGTGTLLNDVCETRAIHGIFGEHAQSLSISATKSMTGHLLGAAGAYAAGVCALGLYHGIQPPTRNLVARDPECDLDYIPGKARHKKVAGSMVNAFGFGGTNVSLVLKAET